MRARIVTRIEDFLAGQGHQLTVQLDEGRPSGFDVED